MQQASTLDQHAFTWTAEVVGRTRTVPAPAFRARFGYRLALAVNIPDKTAQGVKCKSAICRGLGELVRRASPLKTDHSHHRSCRHESDHDQ